MTRVLVFGTFDHLHPGHRFLLDAASQRGELCIVVARTNSVEHIKGCAPEQSEDQRKAALQEAYPDATVTLGDLDDYLAPVRQWQPDLILLGYDQQMPPGVSEEDLECKVERVEAYEPEKYKSSLMKQQK